MKRKHTPGPGTILILFAILIWVGFAYLVPEGRAQNKASSAEYDYYSLALTSISTSAREASKLPDIEQRVQLLLHAAGILRRAQRDEAIRLLDVVLGDLKQWTSGEKTTGYRRHRAATLRNEVLALYAAVDPEKATAFQKEAQAEKLSATNTSATSPKNDSFARFSTSRAAADQSVMIALSLVDTDPDKASTLVLQSLQEGIISGVLLQVVQKLLQKNDRAFLDKLEMDIGKVLAEKATLDHSSLAFASALLQVDPNIPTMARSAMVSFFMGSLEAWSNQVREANGTLDSSYVSMGFTVFSLNVRSALLQYDAKQVPVFDSLMDRLAPWVPESTRSRLEAFQPEKVSDPRDRLNDILKDPKPVRRDLRLVRLVSELMRQESEDLEKNLDLASDVISGFSDPDVKSTYTDLLTIKRIDLFVKQKKFIEAQYLAGGISALETRAWALLALSSVAAKSDRVLGFELISNALSALDKASPSPHKVELAIIGSAMLAKVDPERAFDALTTVSKYANSSASKVDPPAKPPVAFGLEAAIGEAKTNLGVYPESLAELKIEPALSTLATTDWFRAEQTVNNIREPSLRLQLRLQFAEAILARESKTRKNEPAPKTAP